MSDTLNKGDLLFKVSSALTIPVLAWVLSLTSNISRVEQRLLDMERRVENLETTSELIREDLKEVEVMLQGMAVMLEFINGKMRVKP